jgi:hypothetical protein
MKRFLFNPFKGVLLLQVSDIPGVVHMVEYHDMGDSIWIVLERGDHTKVTNISKKVTNFKKKYFLERGDHTKVINNSSKK